MKIEDRRKHTWWYGCTATCEVCGASFGAVKVTARYCSDRCKQKAYRQSQKKKKEAQKSAKRLQKSFALIFD